jgi:hypothetical protein
MPTMLGELMRKIFQHENTRQVIEVDEVSPNVFDVLGSHIELDIMMHPAGGCATKTQGIEGCHRRRETQGIEGCHRRRETHDIRRGSCWLTSKAAKRKLKISIEEEQ